MIKSTTSSDRPALPVVPAGVAYKAPAAKPGQDQFSAMNTENLRDALRAVPEVRPEVVARGLALAADPAYPSTEVLRRVGRTLLRSADLTQDES